MLGRNHALSGAVAWLAVAPAATDLPAGELAVGGLVCAGAALAPVTYQHRLCVHHVANEPRSLPRFSSWTGYLLPVHESASESGL